MVQQAGTIQSSYVREWRNLNSEEAGQRATITQLGLEGLQGIHQIGIFLHAINQNTLECKRKLHSILQAKQRSQERVGQLEQQLAAKSVASQLQDRVVLDVRERSAQLEGMSLSAQHDAREARESLETLQAQYDQLRANYQAVCAQSEALGPPSDSPVTPELASQRGQSAPHQTVQAPPPGLSAAWDGGTWAPQGQIGSDGAVYYAQQPVAEAWQLQDQHGVQMARLVDPNDSRPPSAGGLTSSSQGSHYGAHQAWSPES